MRRREFLGVLGGAAAWPLAASAQQQAMPVVGFLRSTTRASSTHLVAAFQQGLKESGLVEGQDVTVEYRFADNQPDRLPALATEFTRRPVTAIVANDPAAFAVKSVTSTVPIVFVSGSDPVRDGLVASMNRPGANVTGTTFVSALLGPKRLELLRQLIPKPTSIGMLASSLTLETKKERADMEATAQSLGQQLVVLDVNSSAEIEPAFAALRERGAGALFVGVGPLWLANRERVTELAARNAWPAIYSLSEFARAGGLMSYGASISDAYRQAGIYAGRIVKGEKAADLPIMQASKFEFIINLKTAKALGLEIPDRVLALADEVIE